MGNGERHHGRHAAEGCRDAGRGLDDAVSSTEMNEPRLAGVAGRGIFWLATAHFLILSITCREYTGMVE